MHNKQHQVYCTRLAGCYVAQLNKHVHAVLGQLSQPGLMYTSQNYIYSNENQLNKTKSSAWHNYLKVHYETFVWLVILITN